MSSNADTAVVFCPLRAVRTRFGRAAIGACPTRLRLPLPLPLPRRPRQHRLSLRLPRRPSRCLQSPIRSTPSSGVPSARSWRFVRAPTAPPGRRPRRSSRRPSLPSRASLRTVSRAGVNSSMSLPRRCASPVRTRGRRRRQCSALRRSIRSSDRPPAGPRIPWIRSPRPIPHRLPCLRTSRLRR